MSRAEKNYFWPLAVWAIYSDDLHYHLLPTLTLFQAYRWCSVVWDTVPGLNEEKGILSLSVWPELMRESAVSQRCWWQLQVPQSHVSFSGSSSSGDPLKEQKLHSLVLLVILIIPGLLIDQRSWDWCQKPKRRKQTPDWCNWTVAQS